MKKKISLLVVLLVAVVLTGHSVSGTYAKYTSELSGTDTARVAKWAFTINENNADLASATKNFTFDLFNTVGDTGAYANDSVAQDEAVATGVNETIIAPGTSGKFAIKVVNESEVMAKVSTAFEVTNTNGIPVELSIDKEHWFNSDGFKNVNKTETLNANNGETTVTVYWRWNFEARSLGAGETTLPYAQTDVSDTKLGTDAAATGATPASISVKAKLTATQIDTKPTV